MLLTLRLLSFPLLVAPLLLAVAQPDSWTQKASCCAGGRMVAVGFAIGTKGYMGTGTTSQSGETDNFSEYDPISNSWTPRAAVPGGPRREATGFSIGNRGYITTGAGYGVTGTVKKDLWEYDPILNSWIQKADLPGPARYAAFGFSINGKGYVGGGYAGQSGFLDFWEYDPITNGWASKASLPQGTLNAVTFTIGGKGYMGGSFSNPFWVYDPIANTWSSIAAFPASALNRPVGFTLQERGYVGTGGGPGNINTFKDLWEYSPLSDSWTQRADFSGEGRFSAIGFAIGSTGYIGGGSSVVFLSDFWAYQPVTVVGVAETGGDDDRIIPYPVPTGEVLHFSLLWPGTVSISDCSSRILLAEQVSMGNNEIDIRQFEPGVYILQFYGAKNHRSAQFVKL